MPLLLIALGAVFALGSILVLALCAAAGQPTPPVPDERRREP